MKRWKNAALITVGSVLLLTDFVAFVLPGIVKNQMVQRIEAATNITSPHFRIVRLGTNLYNFSDLLKWLPLHPRLCPLLFNFTR